MLIAKMLMAINSAIDDTVTNLDNLSKYVTLLIKGNQVTTTIPPNSGSIIMDSGPNALPITRLGNPVQSSMTPFDPKGYSCYFDGDGDYITIPFKTDYNLTNVSMDFSLECFVYLNENFNTDGDGSTGGSIISFISSDTGSGWNFYISSSANKVGFAIYTPGTDGLISVANTITKNKWYHILIQRRNGISEIAIDGVFKTLIDNSFTLTNLTNGTLKIGALGLTSPYFRYFKGNINNLRIVKGTAIYANGDFTPPTTNLTVVPGTVLLALNTNNFEDLSSLKATMVMSGTPKIKPISPIAQLVEYSPSVHGGSINFPAGTGAYFPPNEDFAYGTGDFTIEGWVYKTSAQDGVIYSQAWSGTNYFVLYNSAAGGFSFTGVLTGAGVGITAGVSTIKLNEWCHIAVVRKNGMVTCYIKGIPGVSSSNTVDYQNTTAIPTVGRYTHSGAPQFVGNISNFRILKGVALYDGAFTPPVSKLTAIPKTSILLNGDISEIKDLTGKHSVSVTGQIQSIGRTSKFGSGSLYFPGIAGDYISCDGDVDFVFGTSDFTIDGWIRQTARSPVAGCVVSFGSTAGLLHLYIDSLGKFNYLNSTQVATALSTALNLNTWYHFAMSRTAGVLKFFLDGVNTYSAADTVTYTCPASMPRIGCSGSTTTEQFIGQMDDLRISKGVGRYLNNFLVPTSTPKIDTLTSLLLDGETTVGNYIVSNNKTMIDSSSAGNLINISNNPTQGSFSPYGEKGYSKNFNGSTDAVRINNGTGSAAWVFGSGDFTVEAWLFPQTTQPGTVSIIGNYRHQIGYKGGWKLALGSSRKIYWYSVTANALGGGVYTLPILEWSHVAVVKKNNVLSCYVNGKLNWSIADTDYYAEPSGGNSLFSGCQIMDGNYQTAWWYNGAISNLHICKGYAVYDGEFDPPVSKITANPYSKLLIFQDNVNKDNSVSNFALNDIGTGTYQLNSPFQYDESYNRDTRSGSYYFKANTDNLIIPGMGDAQAFGTGDFSVEMWIFPGSSAANNNILPNPSGTTSWGFMMYSGQLYWQGQSTNIITTGGAIKYKQWSHLVVCRTNGVLSAYVNGKRGATLAHTFDYTYTGTRNFGPSSSQGSDFYIADFRIEKGVSAYDANLATLTVPIEPLQLTINTVLLLKGDSGGLIDLKGRNDVVTVNQARVSNSQSASGFTSVALDGVTDYLFIPYSSNVNLTASDFTVEMYVYLDAYNVNSSKLYSSDSDTIDALSISIGPTGEVQVASASAAASFDLINGPFGTALSLKTWYHVSVVRHGTNLYGFINGIKTVLHTTLPKELYNNKAIKVIGGQSGTDRAVKGYLDNIRITKFARYTENFIPDLLDFN